MVKTTVLHCPPAHLLALQSAASSFVMLGALVFCALLIALGRAWKPRAYREELADIKEHYRSGLETAKAEMLRLIDALVSERDAAMDRAEQLEAQNSELVERISKSQPNAVQSYQLKPRLREQS